MRKSIKTLSMTFILTITMVFRLSIVALAAEIPSATDEFYVNDFADVFTDEEKEQLLNNAVTLAEDYDGIQVVVTTVESLEGESIEDYALEMYNQYGIGKDDMGLLILLSTGDREIRVEVGLAMEAYINDSKAGRFMDEYAIPYLSENKFNEGLINLQEALIDEIVENIDAEAEVLGNSAESSQDSESSSKVIGILGIIVIVFLVFYCIIKMINKSKGKKQKIEFLQDQLAELNKAIEDERIEYQKKNFQYLKKINDLNNQNNNLKAEHDRLQSKYSTLEDRYNRARTLFKELDQKVDDMIAEEIRQKDLLLAEETDAVISQVIGLNPNKDYVLKFQNALKCYSLLNERQRKYVKSDIDKLQNLCDESVRLKNEYDRIQEENRREKAASDALNSINAIIAGITVGRAIHLGKLKKAMAIYNDLDSGSQQYFDKSVFDRLDKLYRDAAIDEVEERRAERRRREEERHRSSSYSSFRGSSHYSGFGGRSGGGGASRRF